MIKTIAEKLLLSMLIMAVATIAAIGLLAALGIIPIALLLEYWIPISLFLIIATLGLILMSFRDRKDN